MTSLDAINVFESLIPTLFGGALILLAFSAKRVEHLPGLTINSRGSQMSIKTIKKFTGPTCLLPRKQEALEALLVLAWRKGKKERPNWIEKELQGYF